MSAASDLAEDVVELKALLSQSKRPRVQKLISAEIQSLERAQAAASSASNQTPLPLHSGVLPEIRYITLSSFSWDEDAEKVKIYVSLEGASEENAISDFKPTSFDIKFHDVGGKNYRCGVQKLNKAISPDNCAVLVKPKRVVITLKKAEKGNWLDLYYKEDKLKPKLDTDKDPMAGIMDLMKNMYEEGDDEMKKTIAKAWTEAQSGKKPGLDAF